MPERTPSRTHWRLCCATFAVLSILTFTPLIIPYGESLPELMGVPRTLWAGILLAVAFVVVTLIGSIVHPANASQSDAPATRAASESANE